jgi:hypothetical protein
MTWIMHMNGNFASVYINTAHLVVTLQRVMRSHELPLINSQLNLVPDSFP